MPAKLERPFQEGQPGEVYAHCYDEPKTGYAIAKELDIHRNIPYLIKDRYPGIFKDTDNGLLAKIEPLLAAINKDLNNQGKEILNNGQINTLNQFLDTTWREAYKSALESPLRQRVLEQGPYRLFATIVGLLMPWKRFHANMTKQIRRNGHTDLLDKTNTDIPTSVFEVAGEIIHKEDEAKAITELSESLNSLPNLVLEKIEYLPESQIVKKTTENELTKTKKIIKSMIYTIDAVNKNNENE